MLEKCSTTARSHGIRRAGRFFNCGRLLKRPATVEEALREGGLDWKVALIPLQTTEQPPSPVFRRMAVVRTDRESGHRSRVLGVVHPGFRPLQNQDGVKLFDALIGGGKRV